MEEKPVRLKLIIKTMEAPSAREISRESDWVSNVEDNPTVLSGDVPADLFQRICDHPLVHVEHISETDEFIIDTTQMDAFNPFILNVTQFYKRHSHENRRGSVHPRVAVSILKESSGWRFDKLPKGGIEGAIKALERDLPKMPGKSMEAYFSQTLSTVLELASIALSSDSRDIQESLDDIALHMGYHIFNMLNPVRHRMEGLFWVQESEPGKEINSGGYHFRIRAPFHLECQRLSFFILHGLMLEKFPEFGLGIQILLSNWNEKLDLSFVGRRKGSPTPGSALMKLDAGSRPGYIDPGIPHDALHYLDGITSFSLEKHQDIWNSGVDEMISSTLVLMDYAHRLNDPEISLSDIDSVIRFIFDPEFRVSTTAGIPTEYFHQESPLDQAIGFWIKKFKILPDEKGIRLVKKASHVLRSYDFYKKAMANGLSKHEVIIYSEEDHRRNEHKIDRYINTRGNEYYIKWRAYLDVLVQNGPVRYLAPPPHDVNWDEVERIHPNFSEPIKLIRRMVKLAKRSNIPSLTMPPILLVGSPGLGKTFFTSEMARILGTEYHEIPMSTMTAGFILSGLDLSWANGRPGEISEIIAHSYCANPIVILDEIDKASTDSKHDPFGPMYQLLESRTAEKFKDEALRMKLNAGHFIWFATANDINAIPEPIISRMEVFHIPDLTKEQIPQMAQSIYTKIRREHPWGGVFAENLPDSIYTMLEGSNAREMFKLIRRACAAASDRSDETNNISINSEDIERTELKNRMGF